MIPEGKMYDIHLHFSPQVAGNVAEVRWHDSQKVTWNDDGSADFFVTVDGLGEINWWILGYGDQVTVISPPVLHKRLTDICQRTLHAYKEVT
jgi:predicted DNA-binding transcriptional regulator YafY